MALYRGEVFKCCRQYKTPRTYRRPCFTAHFICLASSLASSLAFSLALVSFYHTFYFLLSLLEMGILGFYGWVS